MIKPLLSPVTLDKVRIFGSDKNEWKTSLLAEIDAEQLPAHYGGTMTDPDGNPMCLSIVRHAYLIYKYCLIFGIS